MARRPRVRMVAAAASLMILAGTAWGHGMVPQDTPVERLVSNLTSYVKDHPDDADGHYRLGRVHTMALETKTGFILAFGAEQSGRPAEGSWAKRTWGEKRPKTATPEQLRTHLSEAITHLNKAIELRRDDPRYRLTLACALEAGRGMMQDVEVWPLCPVPGALKPADEREQSYLKYDRDRFAAIPKKPEVVAELIKEMQGYTWRESERDTIMTLAFERRDRPEYKEAAAKLRAADWDQQIEDQYFKAMCLALPIDGKAESKPVWGGMDDWESFEAGHNFVRVVEARKARPSDAIRLKVAKETVKAFDNLPAPNAITPIVIDLAGGSLASLQSAVVSGFDLDGTGRPQRWSWVTPQAGILAWDPERTGRITSGRQLFGSVSWWLFFDHGYQALDALDDNRDGELSGDELEGIAVWFDRDSNGASDPGEVTPVYQLGVAAISCRATGAEGSALINRAGLRMSDGRLLPTYDWVASTVQERSTPEVAGLAAAFGLLSAVGLGVCSARNRNSRISAGNSGLPGDS